MVVIGKEAVAVMKEEKLCLEEHLKKYIKLIFIILVVYSLKLWTTRIFIYFSSIIDQFIIKKMNFKWRDIMQTSVIGFPRIGTLRELKFASEKYFRKRN